MTFSLRESRSETAAPERSEARPRAAARPDREARDDRPARRRDRPRGRHAAQRHRRAARKSIKSKSKDPEAVEKNAEIVAEQTARITRIIQRLLDFTRRKVGTTGKAEVNLNELSLTTMELLAGQFSAAKVKTRLDRAEGLPRVAGDADRLQQVLINLLLNAAQAMPRWRHAHRRDPRRASARGPASRAAPSRTSCSLSVSDTGVGIPAGHPRQDLRPVLHDEGRPRRHGPRPRGVLGHRQGARRLDRDRGRRRRRHRVSRVPAGVASLHVLAATAVVTAVAVAP